MKFWNNSKSQRDKNEQAAQTFSQDRPQDLEQRLVNMHFQARPDFREDLKERLLQRLEEPAQAQPKIGISKAKVIPGLTHYRHMPSRTRLALGGIGLAALLIVLISVLSVGTVYRNPTASASVAAVANPVVPPVAAGNPGTTPAPASGTGSAGAGSQASSSILAALRKYFDPAEAAKTAGFTVNIPGYLPSGYKLTYAAVANPVPNPPTTTTGSAGPTLLTPAGYNLRFGDTTGQTTSDHQIELAQWQVPFTIATNGLTTLSNSAVATGPNTANYQSPQTITISGQPGFVIEGGEWQIQLAAAQPVTATVTGPGQVVQAGQPGQAGTGVGLEPVSAPISGTTIITSAQQISGSTGFTATAAGPIISFTQVGTLNVNSTEAAPVAAVSGGIVVAFSAQDPQIRTLVWQQNNLFTVLTAPANLSEAELKQVAESLRPAT